MRLLRVGTVALLGTGAAALSSKDIVKAFDGITKSSSKTTDAANDLNPDNLSSSVPVSL